jgi:heme/copper-type cytochrome/quinol oxidase subunit 2
MNNLHKWRYYSPLGLTIIGLGCSLLGEAIARKAAAASVWDWFWWGTLALVCINAGVSVFGEGIASRLRHERDEREKQPERHRNK